MMTFYISHESDDALCRRIDYLRKLGSRLDKCTQSAIQSEVETIASLSAWKPDEWTLSHIDEIMQATRKITEAGL